MRSRGRTTSKPVRKPSPDREYWRRMRADLYARANGRCERAGELLDTTGMEAHHRKLRSQGGGHGIVNLLALCPDCHRWVHRHIASARGLGLIVERGHDPAMVAVQLWNKRTVRLDRDGGYDVVWDDSEAGEPA